MFHDHWHLKLNQENELGLHLYAKCKPSLDRLMEASSEELFNELCLEMINEYSALPKVINLVNRMSTNRHLFAAYIIDSTCGSFFRRGSTPSEQNHSSFVRFAGKNFTG